MSQTAHKLTDTLPPPPVVAPGAGRTAAATSAEPARAANDAAAAAGSAAPEPAEAHAPLRPITGPLAAATEAGERYDGDLLTDVLEYRELRTRTLAGPPLSAHERVRLTALENRLKQPPDPSDPNAALRSFRRYDVQAPARLRLDGLDVPARLAVEVEDLSAGGVRLACARTFELGERVSLLLDIGEPGSVTTIVQPSRVAWFKPGKLGIKFAGAPTPSEGEGP